MISLLKKFFSIMGVDQAIVYTLAGRGWGMFSGIVMLLLVVRYLTPDEQGYYYTFASILAMQVFFELGMSVVLMQFASHEMAHLIWSEAGTIEGDANAKNRIHSLFLLMTKWYGSIAVLLIVVIFPVGWIFFSTNHPHTEVNWQSAWIWLVLTAAVNIFIMPLLALLEGCGRVIEVARIRMIQNIIGSLLAWIVLVCGGALLAIPAMSSGLALTVLVWLWRTKRVFIQSLIVHEEAGKGIKWKIEIWPFQWKIALSWLSGYFIFQLFTPVLFAYRGAEEAGQMGMSIAIANALMSISMAWMNTKVPGFGGLVAKRDYINLDRIFSLTLTRSLGLMAVGGVVLCTINYIIHLRHFQFVERILDPLSFTFLILATTLNYVTYAQAAYLRAHKEEPFLMISLISAAFIGVLTISCARDYGAKGMMFGYFAVCLTVGLGLGSVIFFSKRREWQKVAGKVS